MPEKFTSFDAAYNSFRSKGANPGEARRKAEELVRKFLEIKQRKHKHTLTSSQAFTEVRYLDAFRNMQERVSELNPGTRISIVEAANLVEIANDIRRHGKRYSEDDFLSDYAQLRWQTHGNRSLVRHSQFARMVRSVLDQKLGSGASYIGKSLFYFPPRVPPERFMTHMIYTPVIFDRMRRENELHKTENEKTLLEYAFIDLMNPRFELPLQRSRLHRGRKYRNFIQRETRKLRKDPAKTFLEYLVAKVPGFWEKSAAVRERIIQERRSANLGEKIASLMRDNLAGIKGGSHAGVGDGRVTDEDYARHMMELLARSGNRKFLAQKAIEMFPGKRKRV